MMAKRKCSINDSIKSEYAFIEKGVNENGECTLCNAKFCFAHGGRSDVNHAKKRDMNWLFKTDLPITAQVTI
jgi:hypothetical protein